MKILLIDDSKVIHAYLGDLMANSQIDLSHAFNGEEGISLVKKLQPNAILLDWEMPGIEGIEVLKKLRESGFDKPILMLTTKNKPSDLSNALASGASEYIMKPFTKEILLEKLSIVGISLC